ncbi:UNVERIFIED_CONTAM: hypothetical protein H355_002714 [Colinus virginianus]|nr:hypothetical protein H355_002714 [Colinus virginianus]
MLVTSGPPDSSVQLWRASAEDSGFDGSVRIYDTRSWAGAGCHAEPLFVHEGHEWGGTRPRPRVTAHAWHPHRARTLVSAATDGSLHVWDWAQPHST